MQILSKICECGLYFFTTKKAVVLCTKCRQQANKITGITNRRKREQLAKGTHTKTEYMAKVAAQKFLCYWCDKSMLNEKGEYVGTRDHLTPLAKGGRDDIANIVGACWWCNRKKGNRTEEEFLAYLVKKHGAISEASCVPTCTSFRAAVDFYKRTNGKYRDTSSEFYGPINPAIKSMLQALSEKLRMDKPVKKAVA